MRFFKRFNEGARPLADAGAFAHFYESTHLNTFRYIMALTGGLESQAEDITAEAYLRAWKNRLSFKGSSDAALGWILIIARRILIDRYRLMTTHPAGEDLSDDIADDNPDIEAILLTQELSGQIMAALQKLPEKQREMVVLS